jgi:hypothetical protein
MTGNDNPNRLLDLVRTGRMDELSPAEAATLEQHLNTNASAAAALAGEIPASDRGLVHAVSGPSAEEWNAAWSRIESPGGRRASDAGFRRASPFRAFPLHRGLAGLAAVAACIALVLVWRFTPGGTSIERQEEGWPIQLSSANQILEMPLLAGRSATLHYDDDGIAVIAYDDAETPPEGASDDDDVSASPPARPHDSVRRVAR